MKGLLTKDFALFFQRKRTFIFLALWAVVMCIAMNDGSFMVGWMTVISAFFSVSSLTYDEYDNCYPFLMSMPVEAKTYAVEKYLFGFLCGLGAWLYSAAAYLIISLIKGQTGDIGSELVQLAVFIPIFMFLIDISLPINLRYGSERGRMIILILWGVVFVGIFAADKLSGKKLSLDNALIPWNSFVGIVVAAAVVLTAASVILSVRIMKKKEF